MDQIYRTPSAEELAVLQLLLGAEFPENLDLRSQLNEIMVRSIDDDAGMELLPEVAKADTRPRSSLARMIPVEAEFRDADGATAHVLLHIVGGNLHELEYYREDGKRLVGKTTIGEYRVFVP